MKVDDSSWPPVEGEYTVINRSAPVAVSTLASVKLEEKIVKLNPPGLCIVGKTETENIGIDKIVKNVISNPAIVFLILAGKDTEGHQSGKTILALKENGVDGTMRIKGSKGRRPILKNVTLQDVEKFRGQVHIEDMIGTENTKTIAKKIKELSDRAPAYSSSGCGCGSDACMPVMKPVAVIKKAVSGCGCGDACGTKDTVKIPVIEPSASVPTIRAKKQSKESVKLDRAGYFVIITSTKNKNILVEHYSYDNRMLRKIEGSNGRDIYFTIINNHWVTELSHAAYLGKELARAEMSIKKGIRFVQDGA